MNGLAFLIFYYISLIRNTKLINCKKAKTKNERQTIRLQGLQEFQNQLRMKLNKLSHMEATMQRPMQINRLDTTDRAAVSNKSK